MEKLLALSIQGYGEVPAPGGIPTGGLFGTGEKIIQNSLTIFITVGIVFAMFMLLWGGITWITSQGDKAKIQAARNRLIFAIVGLIIILLSFLIIKTVGNLFGVNLLYPSWSNPCSIPGKSC
jgi:hypothetical protein